MKLLSAALVLAASAFAQGIVTTIAGTDYIFPDDGNPALQAHLSTPYGLAFDRQGNLYFSDAGLNMVLKMDTKGVVSVVAGNGLARFAGDGGPARAASLYTPWGVALDAAGSLYIADSGNGVVRKVEASGVITTVAGGGSNSPGDGKPATQASLTQPTAVAFDISGNLLIAERAGQRVRSVNASGIISTIAGTGQAGFSGDGGLALNATFENSEGLAVAPDGTILVADSNNGRVRKILPNGTISTFAGGGNDPNASGGPATAVSLSRPAAVALDHRAISILSRIRDFARGASPRRESSPTSRAPGRPAFREMPARPSPRNSTRYSASPWMRRATSTSRTG
jgi:sugar lactone lactonase YvrE